MKENQNKEIVEELHQEWDKCEIQVRRIEKCVEDLQRIGFDVKMCSLYLGGRVEDNNPKGTMEPEVRMLRLIPELCITLSSLYTALDHFTLAFERAGDVIKNESQ